MFCIMICVAFLIQMVTGDTLVACYVAIQNGCHMKFIIMSYQEISPYINSSYISGSFHTSGQFTRGNMHFHFIDCILFFMYIQSFDPLRNYSVTFSCLLLLDSNLLLYDVKQSLGIKHLRRGCMDYLPVRRLASETTHHSTLSFVSALSQLPWRLWKCLELRLLKQHVRYTGSCANMISVITGGSGALL